VTDPWEEVVLNLEIQPTQEPALKLAVARKIYCGFHLMDGPTIFHES
jgi:hypothetical protein